MAHKQFFTGEPAQIRPRKLVQGLVFDFDNTLARLNKPLDELMNAGAQTAVDYMRSTGMTRPARRDFGAPC